MSIRVAIMAWAETARALPKLTIDEPALEGSPSTI